MKNKLALRILVLTVVALMSVASVALSASSGDIMYVSTPSGVNLNLRAAPSFDAMIIDTYKAGTEVLVLADLSVFIKVAVGLKIGYMSSEYLTFLRDGNTGAPQGSTISSGGSTNSGSTSGGSTSGESTKANQGNATQSVVASGTTTGYISNPKSNQRLNLREQPSTSSAILGSFVNGTPVIIYERQGDWMRVSIYGLKGYVMAKYVNSTSAASSAPQTAGSSDKSSALTVINLNGGSYVNERSGAGYEYSVIQRVRVGAFATYISSKGDWVKVSVNGVTGWMHEAFLK